MFSYCTNTIPKTFHRYYSSISVEYKPQSMVMWAGLLNFSVYSVRYTIFLNNYLHFFPILEYFIL